MILAAHQPHYLPYPGLLAKIDAADVFVIQDDLQYVKQEWQNRNRIRTREGWRWLTIPVHATSTSPINRVIPVERCWPARHRRLIDVHYPTARRTRLNALWPGLEMISGATLAEINTRCVLALMDLFGIRTPVVHQSALHLPAFQPKSANERLITLCRELGCDTYLSGSSGVGYLDIDRWNRAGLTVLCLTWAQTRYEQCFAGWVENLSSIDLLMCVDEPLRALRQDRSIRCLTRSDYSSYETSSACP